VCTVESLRKCMCTRQHEREVWTEMNDKQNNERREKERRQVEAKKNKKQ